MGEGDCEYDFECFEDMVCGQNNCKSQVWKTTGIMFHTKQLNIFSIILQPEPGLKHLKIFYPNQEKFSSSDDCCDLKDGSKLALKLFVTISAN